MKSNNYTISDIAANEMYDFSLYTVSSRAIPSMIDSLKPVQRFYIYSTLKNGKFEFKKVSAVSGIISEFGYNHAETSAASAGQLMAARWANNVCLIEGQGSFGTRQVQRFGAPRYVKTRLHKNFEKYIKDLELSPVHEDPEHMAPVYYLPIIPLVLVNGARGIATAFATTILPRSEQGIIAALQEYIETGNITCDIPVMFPDFTGTTTQDKGTQRHVCVGTYRKTSKTVMLITELPYGYDREAYITILDALEDDKEIVKYEDLCDKSGFRFKVTLKNQSSANWSKKEILKNFKLSIPHTENMNVIDQHGNLKEYDCPKDLIMDFVKFRMNDVLPVRISTAIVNLNEQISWATIRMAFIMAVLNDDIVMKNKTKSQVTKLILQHTSATVDNVDALLALRILSLTKEKVKELKDEIKDLKVQLKYWNTTTPKKQYLKDLDELK